MEDTAIRRFIQKSVPSSFVRVLWNGLKAEMPDNEKLERCAAYFDETWFGGHFRGNKLLLKLSSYNQKQMELADRRQKGEKGD